MTHRTILIVEDDWLIGFGLQSELEQLGHRVIGPALSCAEAQKALRTEQVDLAFVDTELNDGTCEAVVRECRRQGIPVVICSAHQAQMLPAFLEGLPLVAKPYLPETLSDIIAQVH